MEFNLPKARPPLGNKNTSCVNRVRYYVVGFNTVIPILYVGTPISWVYLYRMIPDSTLSYHNDL